MAYRQLPPRNSLPPEYRQRIKQQIKRKVTQASVVPQFGCGLLMTFWLMASLFNFFCSPNAMGMAGLLIVIPAFLLCGFFLWRSLLPALRSWRITDPEVALSSDILRVGEPFQFYFEQTAKSSLEVQSVQLTLLMRESATFQRGTTTTTEKHEIPVSHYRLPGRNFQAGDPIRLAHEFTIPLDGMHSFDSKNNRIEWLIRAEVTIPKWTDVKEEYEIRVLPVRFIAPEPDAQQAPTER